MMTFLARAAKHGVDRESYTNETEFIAFMVTQANAHRRKFGLVWDRSIDTPTEYSHYMSANLSVCKKAIDRQQQLDLSASRME